MLKPAKMHGGIIPRAKPHRQANARGFPSFHAKADRHNSNGPTTQLSLPYGNRAFLRRGRRCPYDLRSARLSQAKSSSFFTGQRREAVASRRASDYSLRNQLASPFPAPTI